MSLKNEKSSQFKESFQYALIDFVTVFFELLIYFLALLPLIFLLPKVLSGSPIIASLVIVFGLVLSGVLFVLQLVLIKRLFIGEIKEGRFLIRSRQGAKWICADRLSHIMGRSFYFPWITETLLLRLLFYRSMGAKIDATTLMGKNSIFTDPWMVELGHKVIVADGVAISGHKVEGNVVSLGKVKVGNNVTIGAKSVIFPDVIIGDNAVIGANSVLTRGSRINDGETWAGVPVVKIDLFEQLKSTSKHG